MAPKLPSITRKPDGRAARRARSDPGNLRGHRPYPRNVRRICRRRLRGTESRARSIASIRGSRAIIRDRSSSARCSWRASLHPFEQSLKDAQTCIDALKGKGPVFITGYCYGGSVAWRMAQVSPDLAAASAYYGSLVPTMFGDEAPACAADRPFRPLRRRHPHGGRRGADRRRITRRRRFSSMKRGTVSTATGARIITRRAPTLRANGR